MSQEYPFKGIPLTVSVARHHLPILLLDGKPHRRIEIIRRMEEVQQAEVAGIRKAQAADQTGDAGQVGARTQGGQHEHQPQEGGGASAGRAQRLEGAQPGEPEEVGNLRVQRIEQQIAQIKSQLLGLGPSIPAASRNNTTCAANRAAGAKPAPRRAVTGPITR